MNEDAGLTKEQLLQEIEQLRRTIAALEANAKPPPSKGHEEQKGGRGFCSGDRFLHLLLDHAADAVFLHDMDGGLRDVNRAAWESLGYTKEELLNMSVADVDGEFEVDLSPTVQLRLRKSELREVGEDFLARGAVAGEFEDFVDDQGERVGEFFPLLRVDERVSGGMTAV